MRSLISYAVIVAAPSVLPAQQTIVVQGGANSFMIAVASANVGATLVVRPGTYWSAAIQKGLTVLCDPGVRFDNLSFGPAFQVSWLPAGQHVTVRGGVISGTVHISYEFGCHNNAGTVTFEDVTALNGAVAFVSCPSVTLRRCTLPTLHVDASNVALHDCQTGGASTSPAAGSVFLESGRLTITGGQTTGPPDSVFGASPAIDVQGGALTITGDAATVVAPGTGTVPMPAVRTTGGTVMVDPDVSLQGRSAPPISGPARVVTRQIPWLGVRGVTAGQPMVVALHAEAGSFGHVFLSWPVPPLLFLDDALWVAPQCPIVFSGVVPQTGSLSVQAVVPQGLRGLSAVLQPLTLAPSLVLRVGTPAPFVVD